SRKGISHATHSRRFTLIQASLLLLRRVLRAAAKTRRLFQASVWWPVKRLARTTSTLRKTLKYNSDGSLTLYAGAKSPREDKESKWLAAPNGPFSPRLLGGRDHS